MDAKIWVETEEELRSIIPTPHRRTTLKIQQQLEATGREWIRNAGLVGLATQRADGLIDVVARAQTQNLAHAPDDHRVLIHNGAEARIGDLAEASRPAGAIFILPGVDSTIRANGQATATGDGIELQVNEAYMHCPKAFVRSRLWKSEVAADAHGLLAEEVSGLGPGARHFIERAPFLLLGTTSSDGDSDVSPRGDPPGFVGIGDDDTLLVPDRPGNHILDSFRNLLANPKAGLLFFIPGVNWALRVSGEARLTADPTRLQPLAMQGKVPLVAIEVRVIEASLTPAPGLAGTWESAASPPRVPSLGRSIIEQVEPKGRFRAIKGKLLEQALKQDAKKNLY